MVKIFIGNLPSDTPAAELRELFDTHGEVSECAVLTNFGFVHMSNEQDAEKAIEANHRLNLRGNVINVELSKGKPKTNNPEKEKSSECFSCGEPGHIAKDCPNKKNEPAKDVCYFCKNYGHVMQNCPLYTAHKEEEPEPEVIDFRRLSNRKAQQAFRMGKGNKTQVKEGARNEEERTHSPGGTPHDRSNSEEGEAAPQPAAAAAAGTPIPLRMRAPSDGAPPRGPNPMGPHRGRPQFAPRRMQARAHATAYGRMMRPVGVDPYGRPIYPAVGPMPPAGGPATYYMGPHGAAPQASGGPEGAVYQERDREGKEDVGGAAAKPAEKKAEKTEEEIEEENRPSKKFLRDSPPPRPKAPAYLLY